MSKQVDLDRLRPLLDFISKGEGGYESMNNGTKDGKIVGSTHNAAASLGKPIAEFTVAEMRKEMNKPRSERRVFAVGRYQIIPKTFDIAVKGAGLKDDDLLIPENQDKLGYGLLVGGKRPALAKWLKGESNDINAALTDLAKEWASFPVPEGTKRKGKVLDAGTSYYAAEGNKASHNLEDVRKALLGAAPESKKSQNLMGEILGSPAPKISLPPKEVPSLDVPSGEEVTNAFSAFFRGSSNSGRMEINPPSLSTSVLGAVPSVPRSARTPTRAPVSSTPEGNPSIEAPAADVSPVDMPSFEPPALPGADAPAVETPSTPGVETSEAPATAESVMRQFLLPEPAPAPEQAGPTPEEITAEATEKAPVIPARPNGVATFETPAASEAPDALPAIEAPETDVDVPIKSFTKLDFPTSDNVSLEPPGPVNVEERKLKVPAPRRDRADIPVVVPTRETNRSADIKFKRSSTGRLVDTESAVIQAMINRTADSYSDDMMDFMSEGTPDPVSGVENASSQVTALSRGWDSGLHQTQSDLNYAKAAMYSLFGDEDKSSVALRKAEQYDALNSRITGATQSFGDLFEQPSVDGFFEKATLTIGQVGPSLIATIAAALATGGTGALAAAAPSLGARKTASTAVKGMVKDAAVKKLKGEALDEAEEKMIAGALQSLYAARGKTLQLAGPGFKKGAVAGAVGVEYPQMTGASAREFTDAGLDITDRPELGAAAVGMGVPLAAVGVYGEKLIAEGVLETAMKRVPRFPGERKVLKDIAASMSQMGLKGGVTEGLTETAQEGGLIAQRFSVDPDYDTMEAAMRLGESAFAGFVVGNTVGSGAGFYAGALGTINKEDPLDTGALRGHTDTISGILDTETGLSGKSRKRLERLMSRLPAPPENPEADESSEYGYDPKYEKLPSFVRRTFEQHSYTEPAKANLQEAIELVREAYDHMDAGDHDKARAALTKARRTTDRVRERSTDQYKQVSHLVNESHASLSKMSSVETPEAAVARKTRDMIARTIRAYQEGKRDVDDLGLRTDGPTVEPTSDLEAQFEHIAQWASSPKKAMWVPENADVVTEFGGTENIPDYEVMSFRGDMFAAKIPGEGIVISKKESVVQAVVDAKLNEGDFEATLADALGYSTVKPEKADRVVRVYDEKGRFVSEEAADAATEKDAVQRAHTIAAYIPNAKVDTVSTREALSQRKKRVDAETGPTVRNMEVDDDGDAVYDDSVEDGESGLSFEDRSSMQEDDGGSIEVANYAPAAGARKTSPEEFETRWSRIIEAVDEDRAANYETHKDDLSDAALNKLEDLVGNDPDNDYYIDVIDTVDSGAPKQRLSISRVGKGASATGVDAQFEQQAKDLEKYARLDARGPDRKHAAQPGENGATYIVVVAPDGKAARPNMRQLIRIGSLMNRTEGQDALFRGEQMSSSQAARHGLMRAVAELSQRGYKFELSGYDVKTLTEAAPDDGSISAAASPKGSRPRVEATFTVRDLNAEIPGEIQAPPLAEQNVYLNHNSGASFTYGDIIGTKDPTVQVVDNAKAQEDMYRNGRRRRELTRLRKDWVRKRNAVRNKIKSGETIPLADMQGMIDRFGDLDNPTNPEAYPDQRERMQADVADKIAPMDMAFRQYQLDAGHAFDPSDMTDVLSDDVDTDQARSAMQAFIKDNPDDAAVAENKGRGAEREANAADAALDPVAQREVDEANKRNRARGPDQKEAQARNKVLGEIKGKLTKQQLAILRNNMNQVTLAIAEDLKRAANDGVIQYYNMYVGKDGTLKIRQHRIPKGTFQATHNSNVVALSDMLPASQKKRFMSAARYLTPTQIAKFFKIVDNNPAGALTVQTDRHGRVYLAVEKKFPSYNPPIMDLQRIVFEMSRDRTSMDLDVLGRVQRPSAREIVTLQNEIDNVKQSLRYEEDYLRSIGPKSDDAARAKQRITELTMQIRRMEAEVKQRRIDSPKDRTGTTRPRPQGDKLYATITLHSDAPSLVRRVMGVATGFIRPNRPVDVFMAEDLEARLEDLVESGHVPVQLRPIILEQLQMFKEGKARGVMISRNRHMIIINDFVSDTPLDEAAQAAALGHELGHVLFQEEFGSMADGTHPDYDMLLKEYERQQDISLKAGRDRKGFEEWYSDQVAAYVYRHAAGMKQNRDPKSNFKVAPDTSATSTRPEASYFRRIANRLRALFTSLNKLLKGRLTQNQKFVDYFEQVIARRRDSRRVNPPLSNALVVRHMTTMDQLKAETPIHRKIGRDMKKLAKNFMDDPVDAFKRTFYASEDYLRAKGLTGVAQFFYGRSQSTEEMGFHRAKTYAQNQWFTRLSDALGMDTDGMTDSQIDDILFEAEDNTIPNDKLSDKARAVRQVFDDMYDQYLTRPDGKTWFAVKKGDNYAPRQFDTALVAKHPEAFNKWLVSNGWTTQAEADAITAKFVDLNGELDADHNQYAPLDTPIMPHGKARSLAHIPTKALRTAVAEGADPEYGWLMPPQLAMTRYMHYMARKIEFERRGGKAAFEEALYNKYGTLDVLGIPKGMANATPEQIDAALEHSVSTLGDASMKGKKAAEIRSEYRNDVNAIEANLGKLGSDIRFRPNMRQINSISQVTTAVTTLTFAVLASLPDLAGVLARTKDFGNFMSAMRELWSTLTEAENAELARAVGVVTSQSMDSIFFAPGEMDFTAPWAKKIMNKFFIYNGTEWYTRFTRTFASGMGREFLVNTAFREDFNATHERWLRELGVTREEVMEWDRFGQPSARMAQDGTLENKIAKAIARFSDESIIRPDAAMKPSWAANPYFTIVWQLKSYFYAYGKVVVAGMAREAYTRGVVEGQPKQAALQLALLAGAMLPLTALGLELREWIKYMFRSFAGYDNPKMALMSDNMSTGEYAFEILDRSGMMGPFSLAISTFEGIEREGAFGPVISNVPALDMVDDSVIDGNWERILPVVNNL